MGERLSDIEINIAQQMLSIQFPSINGLNSTLCQETDERNQHFSTNWLLIIFCKSRSHWVAASTIACELGTVKVFDSLFHKLDEESTHTILNYMPRKDQNQIGRYFT